MANLERNEYWVNRGQNAVCFLLTSKPGKLVPLGFTSNFNIIYKLDSPVKILWKAKFPICKTVKSVFLQLNLERNEYWVNRSQNAVRFLLTSKPGKLVPLGFISNFNIIYKLDSPVKILWIAKFPICKTVKSVFLWLI